jgi:C_GCAxxG_C_C family probable redox protein
MAVGQEKMNTKNEAIVKAMGALGGGIAGSGRVCGALLGGVAFISTLYSRGNLEEKENPRMWRLGSALNKKFEELTRPFGGVNCAEIARVDWSDRDQVKAFYSNSTGRLQHCLRLVEDTAVALGEILDQQASPFPNAP